MATATLDRLLVASPGELVGRSARELESGAVTRSPATRRQAPEAAAGEMTGERLAVIASGG